MASSSRSSSTGGRGMGPTQLKRHLEKQAELLSEARRILEKELECLQTEEGILRSQLSDLTTPRKESHCSQGGPTGSQAPAVPSVSDVELIQGRNLPTLNLDTDRPCLTVGGHLQRKSLVDMESEIEEEEDED